MSTLTQDLRFATRSFVRAPRFTIPAVLALALGIGATSAIYSAAASCSIRSRTAIRTASSPSGRATRDANRPRNGVGAANFLAWRERSRSFAYLGASSWVLSPRRG
jgi:putative ABC transport system permease protein